MVSLLFLFPQSWQFWCLGFFFLEFLFIGFSFLTLTEGVLLLHILVRNFLRYFEIYITVIWKLAFFLCDFLILLHFRTRWIVVLMTLNVLYSESSLQQLLKKKSNNKWYVCVQLHEENVVQLGRHLCQMRKMEFFKSGRNFQQSSSSSMFCRNSSFLSTYWWVCSCNLKIAVSRSLRSGAFEFCRK